MGVDELYRAYRDANRPASYEDSADDRKWGHPLSAMEFAALLYDSSYRSETYRIVPPFAPIASTDDL